MGVVHLGRAVDGRRVAVKVLRPHVVGDDEARDRLAREVSSLSRVKSPRVAEIIDADPFGPIPYVATRYVPGLSLSDHVREEGVITGGELAWFARALAEALDAVHAAGVLHRDIKPSNVLMEGRTPILIDFGLARVADDVRLTRTGWLLGTPGYIAPEVLFGHEPAPSADVHGWAATVAYAGTGRAPYGRGHSMAIMDRVRRGEHDLDGLDGWLRPLVTRALDPEPSRRPTLGEVLRTLGGTPTAPVTTVDDVPLTEPHDLEGLLWSLGSDTARRFDEPPTVPVEAPVEDAVDEPVTRLPPEPPTRPYDEAHPPPYLQPAPPYVEHGPPAAATVPPNSEPYQTPPPADWAPPRTPASERLRRGLLGLGALAGLGAVAALAPYLTVLATTALVVLLRAMSLTGTRAADRQVVRGRKWYDGVLTPLSAPWFLLTSLPGTLLLLVYAFTLAGSGALVGAALGLEQMTVLFGFGVATGVLLWTGPGASRLRAPLRRLDRSLSRDVRVWAGVTVLLVIATLGTLALTVDRGPDWSPGTTPWGSGTWLGRHL
jgi:serine/threonine protein kinase